MNPEPPISSHNALQRKIQRRCLLYRGDVVSVLPALVPALCTVAYLLRDSGWGGLLVLTWFLWLLGSAFSLLPALLFFSFRPSSKTADSSLVLTPQMRASWLLSLLL